MSAQLDLKDHLFDQMRLILEIQQQHLKLGRQQMALEVIRAGSWDEVIALCKKEAAE